MNGKTIPLPSEFTTPPASTSQTCRGNSGSRLRRYVASDLIEPANYATRVELEARVATYELAETFVISRDSSDESRVGRRRDQPRRADRVRGGNADRALLRGRRQRGRVPAWLPRRSRRRPVRARRDSRRPAGHAAHSGRARGPRPCAPRPLRQADRPAGLAAARPSPRGAADLLDGLARRSRRHGAPCGARRAALSPAEAQARRGATASTSNVSVPSGLSPTCRCRLT